jgi:poly-gamma-glutamate synthesis protein (capsule biosynthesis protein)
MFPRALAALSAAVVLAGAGAGPDTRLDAQSKSLSVALTGDSIISQRLAVYDEPPFLDLMQMIRRADVAFTNLETLFHDYESWPQHASGGTWMRAEPTLVKELVWAGFDLVSRANNHAGDYGPEAMNLTSRYVREAGLVEAGVGNSLAEAREARFLESPRGRVALVSAASTFPDHSRAGTSRGDIPARPGLNPLRHTVTTVVRAERMAELRRIVAEVNGQAAPDGEPLNFFGRRFVTGDTPGVRTAPHPDDVRAIAAVVKSASTLSDLVIVSLHAHESGTDRTRPADFIVAFAHAVIDAGADVFVGHGPHVLRGVEIYKGKPIFYSLANFIFQNETLLRMPDDSYQEYGLTADGQPADYLDRRYDNDRRSFPADRENWDSVVALTTWEGRRLTDVVLQPITLGFGGTRAARGRPRLAAPPDATRILEALSARSRPYGTRLDVRNGLGVISVGTTSSRAQR